jgi:hypothetical protein
MVKFCHILSTIHNISYPAFCSILSQKSVILLPDTGILTLPPPPTPFDPPNAGIETIGVSWGFRSFGELFAQHPAAIIDDPIHIPSLF